MSDGLLIRHAEALYWFARYMERIECVARIVDVHTVLAREIEGRHNWRSVLQLYSWLAAFEALGAPETMDRIVHYALLDERNPGSLAQSLRYARENARILRPRLSTEVWNHINRLARRLANLKADDLRAARLPSLCNEMILAVQAHTGIIEGTLMRDAGWCFYQLGRMIERGDQTTRILDTKYHILLPSLSDVDTDLDHNQWANLLRSLGAYHAFQRRVGGVKDVRSVGRFLLYDTAFPRSLGHVASTLAQILTDLRRLSGVQLPAEIHDTVDTLAAIVQEADIERAVGMGFHEFLDGVQRDLIRINDLIAASCFTYTPSQGAGAVQSQGSGGMAQSQGTGGMSQRLGDMVQTLDPVPPG